VLVLGGVHAATQGISHAPQLGLIADHNAGGVVEKIGFLPSSGFAHDSHRSSTRLTIQRRNAGNSVLTTSKVPCPPPGTACCYPATLQAGTRRTRVYTQSREQPKAPCLRQLLALPYHSCTVPGVLLFRRVRLQATVSKPARSVSTGGSPCTGPARLSPTPAFLLPAPCRGARTPSTGPRCSGSRVRPENKPTANRRCNHHFTLRPGRRTTLPVQGDPFSQKRSSSRQPRSPPSLSRLRPCSPPP